jgi:hypothetical protein
VGIHYKEKEIDGQLWTVTEFSATEGLRLLLKLSKLLGRPLGKAISGLIGDGSGLDHKIDFSIVGEAVGELAERMDEAEVETLVKRLLRATQVDHKEVTPQFDILFQRRYVTLFKVLAFVIEVNFDLPLDDWMKQASEEAPLKDQTPAP